MPSQVRSNRFFCIILSSVAICCLTGCDSGVPLGKVSGHVTKGGKPQKGIMVKFEPAAGGRFSTGLTDDSGYYELNFTDRKGALLGTHHVTVEIPEKYNESMFVVRPAEKFITVDKEVSSGSNTFDFEISGDAKASPAK
jgi:hypothetical protein